MMTSLLYYTQLTIKEYMWGEGGGKSKKKLFSKILKKITKMHKNMLRPMVEVPSQSDYWFKSYSQKTTILEPFSENG